MAQWRAMAEADLPAVEAIAAALHPDHPERPEVFAERLTLAPEGCLLLADASGPPLGLAITHPWSRGAPPPLDALLGALPENAGCWHIHDVALLPAARGQGQVSSLLAMIALRAAARRIAALTLVAVGGTEAVWARHGFAALAGAEGPALASYGPGAVPMQKALNYITGHI